MPGKLIQFEQVARDQVRKSLLRLLLSFDRPGSCRFQSPEGERQSVLRRDPGLGPTLFVVEDDYGHLISRIPPRIDPPELRGRRLQFWRNIMANAVLVVAHRPLEFFQALVLVT